jgi:DNA polymerase elongation subunit (family B)
MKFAKQAVIKQYPKISGDDLIKACEMYCKSHKYNTPEGIEKLKAMEIQEMLDKELILGAAQHATDGAKAINDAISRPPMNIEFEKILFPLIMVTPKRYKGIYRANMNDVFDVSIKSSGLVDLKRSNVFYTKKCFKEITESLFNHVPKEKVHEIFKRQVRDLLDGNVETKDLVMTTKIGENYKASLPAHVVCANRIKERGDARQYYVNDRIPTVIIQTEDFLTDRPMSKAPKLSDETEGYYYTIEHELPINYLHYASNVCLAPLLDIIALIHPEPIELIREVCKEYDLPKWFRINWKTNKYAL